MKASNLCLICSGLVLLHARQQKRYWYCNHCREYFPEAFQRQVYTLNCSRSRITEPAQLDRLEQQQVSEMLVS